METLTSFDEELSREDFDAIPFINADGYHATGSWQMDIGSVDMGRN